MPTLNALFSVCVRACVRLRLDMRLHLHVYVCAFTRRWK